MADPPLDLPDASSSAIEVPPIDLPMFLRPVVLKSVVVLAVGTGIIAWPQRSDRIIAQLIAVAALGTAGAIVVGALRRREWPTRGQAATAAGALALGAVLIAAAGRSSTVLGRLLGWAVLVIALRSGVAAWPQGLRALAAPAMTALVGIVLLTYPARFLELFTVVMAAGWIAASLIVLFVAFDPKTARTVHDTTMTEVLRRWCASRPETVDPGLDLVSGFFDMLFYEGPKMRARLSRFFALMGLAAVIAAGGVVTDSTAVVIGAMLVAPLMKPLMGMAVSLIMGWPNRLLRSTSVALGGTVLTIGISLVVGRLLPTVIDTTTNAQIVARANPNLLDLVIAVAAGAAGAFGLSRPDVSDALPGVAIAVSLVPPLAVVGLAYSQGDWAAGNGALLLFATNMVAILTVGGLTFIVTGITPLSRVAESQHRVRTGVTAVATATVIVLGGLFLNSTVTATNRQELSRSRSLVDDWLGDVATHRAIEVRIDDSLVTAIVAGPDDGLGNVDDLASLLSDELGRPIAVDLTLHVQQRLRSGD